MFMSERLWIKNIWIISGVLSVLGMIVQNIFNRIFDWSWDYLLVSNIILSFSDLLFIIGIIIGVIFIIIGLREIYPRVEYIDGVQAYIFFPKGTTRDNQTLKYHGTLNTRRKLIVNLKVNPPKAYYLPTASDSYGWQLIKKYSGLWVSELESNTERSDFAQKWCAKQGYELIPRTATKKDLLEYDSSAVVSSTE
jgi:hypothetical protein